VALNASRTAKALKAFIDPSPWLKEEKRLVNDLFLPPAMTFP
jgi:hypothetical protein